MRLPFYPEFKILPLYQNYKVFLQLFGRFALYMKSSELHRGYQHFPLQKRTAEITISAPPLYENRMNSVNTRIKPFCDFLAVQSAFSLEKKT